jgi:hypothetical protein
MGENLDCERPMTMTSGAVEFRKRASIVPNPIPEVAPTKTAVGDVPESAALAVQMFFKEGMLKAGSLLVVEVELMAL